MLKGRTLSLQVRQLLAASLALLAFLGITGYALNQAFQETAWSALRERLQNYAYAYYGGIEVLRDGSVQMPERSPDDRFDQPGGGLYVIMISDEQQWQSTSALGRELVAPTRLPTGTSQMVGPISMQQADGTTLELYRFTQSITWVDEDANRQTPITLAIFEEADYLTEQIRVFQRALWAYLGLAGVLLLIVQTLVLRWSLRPLINLEGELGRIHSGEDDRLSENHPRELVAVTGSINALIESERRNLEISRHTLADLAHSLKTPLAVLRARLDAESDPKELRREVFSQVQRMDDIVSYQLSRAARGGHRLFAAPLGVAEKAEDIVQSLEKIYAAKGILCEFEVDENAKFHGELGDLQELLGNLLENAFKWANARVLLCAEPIPAGVGQRPGLLLAIEDDGPGIAEDKIAHVLQRGVRGDERVQGHGIGLSIVQDLVAAYRGELLVSKGDELSGARFEVRIPPTF